MFDVLKNRWRGKTNTPSTHAGTTPLSHLLANYAPIALPHQGNPKLLTTLQVQENFDYWQQVLPLRVDQVRQLLTQFDIHWPDTLAGSAFQQALTETRLWAKTQWPAVRANMTDDTQNLRTHWKAGYRSDAWIALSMISDLALLFGELIIANRPTLSWAMDTDATNRDDGMPTVNRLVLQGQWIPLPSGTTICIDIEQAVFTTFAEPDNTNEKLFNTWERLITSAIRGEHEGTGVVTQ